MNLALVIVGIAIAVLVLKAVGLQLMSEAEIEQLDAIHCPVCKKNVGTIIAIRGLVRWIRLTMARLRNFVRRASARQAESVVTRIDPRAKKSATNHS